MKLVSDINERCDSAKYFYINEEILTGDGIQFEYALIRIR